MLKTIEGIYQDGQIQFTELPQDVSDRHPHPEDIFWVIEVAKTSLKKDLEIKGTIYATAGIQEYWVLDLSTKQVIVFRNPQGDKYLEEYRIGEGVITPLAFRNVLVAVEKLFPPT